MPKYPKNLFESDVAALKWGVTPGGHVAHLIDPKTTPAYTEISSDVMGEDKYQNHRYDAKKVSQAEAYNNAGDNLTAGIFMRLAQTAAKEYARPGISDAYRDTLLEMKKIVTISGRQAQQDAIRSFKKKAYEAFQSTNDPQTKAGLSTLAEELTAMNQGTLRPEGYTYDKKSIQEPGNTIWGKFGIWTSTDDALFPHEPSPNDIKQGYGVQDCFLMAPLLRMAATDPKKIKDAMRDNGDGTVTVRFFKENKESHSKEPAYVTVNKTVNKLAGKANVYASSSLWVQMMEKAYIEYLTQHVQVVPNTMGKNYEHSFTDINRSYSYQVLNALEGDKVYADGAQFGFALDGEAYKPGAPKAEKYADLEKKMYRFFDEHVNQKKETIILGNNGLDNNGRASKNGSYAKEHGIRTGHAYAVMGVFEKDGKQYVQVRDPYALFRSKYDDHGKLVNDQAMLSGTGKGGVSNMGTFNLEMKDFLQTFNYSLAMETSTNKEFIELTDAFIDVKKATSVSKTSKKAGVSTQLSDEFEIVDNKGNSVSKAEPKAAEDKGIGFLDDAEVIENPAKAEPKAAEGKGTGFLDDAEIIDNPVKAEPNVTKSDLVDRMNFEEMDDGLEMDDEDPVEAEKTVEQKQEKDDSFADDFEEMEKPYSDALLNALNEPGGKERMAETVKELAEDLEKTAMFFSFKNTKNFTTMRDMLNNVNKKLQGGKYVSNETLATDLTALSEAAETYANSKLESVKATIDSKKEPSLRAMHRLADAVSLMGLKDGNMDIAKGDLSYAESLQIVKDDLTGILKGNVPGMKPTAKEAAASALKAVESHVKSNQALNEEFGLVKPEMNDFLEVNNTQPTVQNASASLG